MAPYTADIAVRWSDQDAFGHVNHAAVVTLLEEARAKVIFDVAPREGVAAFETLVATLEVSYRRPIPWSTAGVQVTMWTYELRAASFRVLYHVRVAGDDGKPAVEASTQLVPYDLAAVRPRRLASDERAFLARFGEDG